ncbi:LPXTG cell wall anchor domain-containing protein [Streptomyces sp. CAU 1734]|uniref:DUF11 domain-containing protein n=1 Tax=Streptomyces sp. CAU 1734 TaxID=3140360 RepID=UPI0032613B6B
MRSEFGSGGAARSESAGSAPSAAGKSAETGAAAADDNTESVWRLVDGELTFDYRITVVNHGPSRAVDVVITDELPPALAFVSSPDGCTAQGRTIRCGPLPALAVGRSHTWMIIVALDEDYTGDGSDITNVAVVSSATEDPDPDNNAATHTGLPVPPRSVKADLALRKTAVLPGGKRYVSPGDTFSYRITVRNLGPGEARGVLVTDPLPAPLVFDSSPDGCRLSAGSARTVTCPVRDRLAAGDSAVYVLVVRVPASGPRAGGDGHGGGGQREEIDNIATVTARTPDPVLANNSNAAGTTGPGGGPLHLVRPSGHTTHPTRPPHTGHPSHPANPGGPHHPGRPQLPHTGGDLPGWLPWSAALTLAGGCALVVLARRGGRSRH